MVLHFNVGEYVAAFFLKVLLKTKGLFYRAISSVGSEHLVYTEGVGGSNPSSPTIIEFFQKYLQNKFARFKKNFYFCNRLEDERKQREDKFIDILD
jgi:hypothetical protein